MVLSSTRHETFPWLSSTTSAIRWRASSRSSGLLYISQLLHCLIELVHSHRGLATVQFTPQLRFTPRVGLDDRVLQIVDRDDLPSAGGGDVGHPSIVADVHPT